MGTILSLAETRAAIVQCVRPAVCAKAEGPARKFVQPESIVTLPAFRSLLEIVNQDRTLRAVQPPLPVCLALPACTAMERGCPRQRLNVLRAHTRRLRGYLSATCEATLPLVATGTRTLLLQMFLYSLRLASIKAAGSSFLAVGRLLPILLTVAMLLLLSVGVVECLWLDLVVQCVSMVPMLCLRML